MIDSLLAENGVLLSMLRLAGLPMRCNAMGKHEQRASETKPRPTEGAQMRRRSRDTGLCNQRRLWFWKRPRAVSLVIYLTKSRRC